MLPLCGTLRGETLTFRVQEKQMWSWVRGGVPLSLVEPLNTRKALSSHWFTLLVLSSYQTGKDKKQQVPEEPCF